MVNSWQLFKVSLEFKWTRYSSGRQCILQNFIQQQKPAQIDVCHLYRLVPLLLFQYFFLQYHKVCNNIKVIEKNL